MGTRHFSDGRPLARVIVAVGVLLGARLGGAETLVRGAAAGAYDPNDALADVKPWVLGHLEQTAPLPAEGDPQQQPPTWRVPTTHATLVSPEILWWLATTRAPLEVARDALARMLASAPDPLGVAALAGTTLATVLRLMPAPVAEFPLLALALSSAPAAPRWRRRPGQPGPRPAADGLRFDIFLRRDLLPAAQGDAADGKPDALLRALLVPSLVQAAQLNSLPEMQQSLPLAQKAVLASRDPRQAQDALAQVLAIELVREGQAAAAMQAYAAEQLSPAQTAALDAILRDPRPRGDGAPGGLVLLVNAAASVVARATRRPGLPGGGDLAPARDLKQAALSALDGAADWWAGAMPRARTLVLGSLGRGAPAAIAAAGFSLPPALLEHHGLRSSADRVPCDPDPRAGPVERRRWGRYW